MTQDHPQIGDVFVDVDYRSKGRRLELVARINPTGTTPPYWQARPVNLGRITAIREDRLMRTKFYRYEDPQQ